MLMADRRYSIIQPSWLPGMSEYPSFLPDLEQYREASKSVHTRSQKPSGVQSIKLSRFLNVRVSGEHEGSALQGLGWSACVPKNSSLKKGKALHILCMVSASQSAENCALL